MGRGVHYNGPTHLAGVAGQRGLGLSAKKLKRNVWALKNDKAVVSPVKSATRCPARASTTVSKTKRLLNTRK
eukprot:1576357-Pyramimonas_sp.AAC.1